MGIKLKSITFVFIFAFLTTGVYAAVPFARPGTLISEKVAERLKRRISLDLRDIPVIDVVKFLSTKAELNIITSQDVGQRVTLFLDDVSIASALEIILISAGLAIREKDGILYIMTEEEYAALYGESYSDQREIRILQLKYTDPDKVGEILGGIKSAIGKIIIDSQTATLVLIDTAEKIKMMEEMAWKIDIPTVERILPTQTEVFELSYNSAEDLQAQAALMLTENVGTVQFDVKTNRILVTDFPHVIEKIRTLVEAFDRKVRQVFIETRMIQVRLNNEYTMGINWDFIFNESRLDDNFFVRGNLDFPLTTTSTNNNNSRLIFGDFEAEDFVATVDMLHIFGDTRTLASPQLAVRHGEEAQILVGTKEAYVTSTVTTGDTTTTSESIEFIDVGVSLKIKAEINQDRFISLEVSPEVSSVGRTLTTPNESTIPIVDTTNATTRVLAKDGHTVMIGGLIRDEISKSVNKVPVLGDIPILGAMFRSTDDSVTKTELVIFLTPHIVEGDEPFPIMPRNPDLLRESSSWPSPKATPFSPQTSSKKFMPFREVPGGARG